MTPRRKAANVVAGKIIRLRGCCPPVPGRAIFCRNIDDSSVIAHRTKAACVRVAGRLAALGNETSVMKFHRSQDRLDETPTGTRRRALPPSGKELLFSGARAIQRPLAPASTSPAA